MNVTVREFCLRPGKYLASLPFNLVRYDRVVAVVSEPWEPEIEPKKNIEKSIERISTKNSDKKKEVFEELKKDPRFLKKSLSVFSGVCKHGAALGNCKFGCQKEGK